MYISAGEFKAKCLSLMDKVKESHEEIIITKYSKPVARLLPVEGEPEKPLFGYLKGSVVIEGDIISSLEEEWDAEK
ncbi:MAG: type II toxin-antitoxin system prevent-host-death family antitoxin [Candidatus Eremiobacterota bacterium]